MNAVEIKRAITARKNHFRAVIADLQGPVTMPAAICGYDDTYTSRLTAKYPTDSENVPWERKHDSRRCESH